MFDETISKMCTKKKQVINKEQRDDTERKSQVLKEAKNIYIYKSELVMNETAFLEIILVKFW